MNKRLTDTEQVFHIKIKSGRSKHGWCVRAWFIPWLTKGRSVHWKSRDVCRALATFQRCQLDLRWIGVVENSLRWSIYEDLSSTSVQNWVRCSSALKETLCLLKLSKGWISSTESFANKMLPFMVGETEVKIGEPFLHICMSLVRPHLKFWVWNWSACLKQNIKKMLMHWNQFR